MSPMKYAVNDFHAQGREMVRVNPVNAVKMGYRLSGDDDLCG